MIASACDDCIVEMYNDWRRWDRIAGIPGWSSKSAAVLNEHICRPDLFAIWYFGFL